MAKKKQTLALPMDVHALPNGSARKRKISAVNTNPDSNPEVTDGKDALRASSDAAEHTSVGNKSSKTRKVPKPMRVGKESSSSLSDLPAEETEKPNKPISKKSATKEASSGEVANDDPDGDVDESVEPEELEKALARPPAVNSSYLPLPWKGRLGYACLNTYLRAATPPVFSSRTCRIASILEHRHPLKDPSQPEHATKNRPDKTQPADPARGQAWVEALGLANARDIPKMLRWNDKYGIRFLRLSSEMFPFASHDMYGYKLTPFASEALAEAGRVATELGHRLTTHPGQFTQLGSPRSEVIAASIRDLEYHCELLDLLKLPPQQDRDAVMILHMGGIFGDKQATIERFKKVYETLSQKIKDRLVLENDDVCYTVHDILPVCEELNIPMVLDYHHNNILFDDTQIREGTLDIMSLYDRIKATWDKKGITQKMHYSEPCAGAVTARQRRKHNPRVYSMPPCAPDMDLMIEAKDKEQAVFEIMRNFRLPGSEKINDLLPYTRMDENKPWKPPKKKTPKRKKGEEVDEQQEPEPQPPSIIPDEEVSMGGPDNRVYWPPGMDEWLRPKKREVKPRDPEKLKSTAEKAAERRAEKAAWQAAREASAEAATADTSMNTDGAASVTGSEMGDKPRLDIESSKSVYDKAKTSKTKPVRAPAKNKSVNSSKKPAAPPSTSDSDSDDEDVKMPDLSDSAEVDAKPTRNRAAPPPDRRQSARGTKRKAVNYAEI